MRHLTGTFLRGLLAILPAAITIWLVVWLAMATERLLRSVFLFLLPEQYYLPGLGFALGVVVVYLVGLLVQVIIVNRLWAAVLRLFESVPLVKTVYSALSDFVSFFTRRPEDVSAVVSVDLLGNGTRMIGFVTGASPFPRPGVEALANEGAAEEEVAVYLPLSYQIGGYTVLVSRSKLAELDMGVEEAMRLVLTAGIQTQTAD